MTSNAQASVSKPNVTLNNSEKGKQQDNGLHNLRFARNWNKKRETFNNPKPERKTNAVSKKLPLERRGRQKGAELDFWDNHLNVDLVGSERVDSKHFSSKKHNLNHLLNFSFTPRETTHESRCNQKYARNIMKHSKGRFLQANCQFIVKKGNDYSKHKIDADLPVDWDLVEEVRFHSLSSESIVCPICLHAPTAAKITKCGHIYCWSCMLHYLALSDQSYRKCPICFDAVYRQDLRSVLSVPKIDFKVGDEIVMCLMKRKKGSTISVPAPEKYEADLVSIEDDVTLYHKLLIASPSQVLRLIVSREKEQLEKQMVEEGNTPEVCFIESALQTLKEREASLKIASTTFEDVEVGASALPSCSPPSDFEIQKKHVEKDDYYFYQSKDGQHIYLHSLNVRMLCKEYGSLEQSPTEVKARIVEVEWSSMSEEGRKRHRYMQHLPLSCEFRIVELLLKPPILSEETVATFKVENSHRENERKRRAREEHKRDKHLKVEQQKRIHGIYPLPRYQLNNLHHFPICSNDSVTSPPSPTVSEVSLVQDTNDVKKEENENVLETQGKLPSFASMLKDGKKMNLATALVAEGEKNVVITDVEGYCSKPTHQYSLSDAFEAALILKDSKRKKKRKK
ncbi:RING finger protein 10-like isoform X2 [Leptotrombidium deliense]|uniref:E3 ubiquitin-protein ligase RNF10 n=1 Tax=Leptotrombidium deliense TaxID=299467 RepID=A0A443SS13_9ACAR|nr:RING finger protein 10-like isoform X2 [Leptotrombidium deliense]